MITHLHRVAIARILSDLIKSDKIIEQSEIQLYNQLQQTFGITQKDRIDAQYITLSRAIMDVRNLDDHDKEELRYALSRTANADNQCVSKEALILLALKYVLEDDDEKYEVLSCPTNGSYIDDKFMAFIDSCDLPDDDKDDLETIIDKLKLWNIEFVYIPQIAEKLKSFDPIYVKSIIQYMNPRFSDGDVEDLYNRLISITTANFTTQLLSGEMKMPTLKEAEPSLLINYATSAMPYCLQDSKGQTYTEFLRIRLDDSKLEEVKKFICDYDRIITLRECVRANIADDNFRYYGFYKVLFDFLSHSENGKLLDKDVVFNPKRRTVWLEGKEVKMSPMHISLYAMILQQSIHGHGIPRFSEGDRNNVAFKVYCNDLTKTFRKIYRSFTPGDDLDPEWQFEDHVRNIAGYVSRIISTLKKAHLHNEGRFIPYQHVMQDGMSYYTTNISVEDVYIINDTKKQEDLRKNKTLTDKEVKQTALLTYPDWE